MHINFTSLEYDKIISMDYYGSTYSLCPSDFDIVVERKWLNDKVTCSTQH